MYSLIKYIYIYSIRIDNFFFFQSDGVVRISPSRGARVYAKQVNVNATRTSLWKTFENMLFTTQINGKKIYIFRAGRVKTSRSRELLIQSGSYRFRREIRGDRGKKDEGDCVIIIGGFSRNVSVRFFSIYLLGINGSSLTGLYVALWAGGFNECIILMSRVLVKRTPWILIIVVKCVCVLHKHWKLDPWIVHLINLTKFVKRCLGHTLFKKEVILYSFFNIKIIQ